MDINKYTSFFHDGTIMDIKRMGDEIEVLMESCQVRPEWNKDKIPLSDYQTIKGKLRLEGVKSISVNQRSINDIKMVYDSSDISTFDIYNNKVKFLVTWIDYPPKKRREITETIEIEANKIYWENIPNLIDPREIKD